MNNKKALFFLTDKYPYGSGEAFIENEISILSENFDKIFVVPTGLTVDVSLIRKMPENCVLIPAPDAEYIYKDGQPTTLKRIEWTVKNMLIWILMSFFSTDFYRELCNAHKEKKLSLRTIVGIVRVLAPELRNRRHWKKHFKLLENSFEDIYVYSYWIRPCLLSVSHLCEKIFRREPVKKICRGHSVDIYYSRKAYGYIPFRTYTIEASDKIFVVSNNGYDYLKNEYPNYADKIRLSYLGTKEYGLQRTENKKDHFLIVSCSNAVSVKRIHLIIDTLSEIKSNIPIKWIHIGGGALLNELKIYASQKLKNIDYEFMGSMPNKDVVDFYQKSYIDLFINMSEIEGLPVSIMEAMSFGIPVVATDVGGTADAVINGENGYLLNKDFQISDAVFYIKRLLNASVDDEHRKKSKALWEEKFNAEKNYREFINEIV